MLKGGHSLKATLDGVANPSHEDTPKQWLR